jgi:hypothetical protein
MPSSFRIMVTIIVVAAFYFGGPVAKQFCLGAGAMTLATLQGMGWVIKAIKDTNKKDTETE